jgi:dihydrolipoamide dehydrogenase
MARKVAVIGGGPGGYVCAARAAQLGADVTLVEMGEIGGTCLNRGCIPTKAIRASTRAFIQAKRAQEMGIRIQGPVTPDWEAMLGRASRVVGQLARGIERMLRSYGVRLVSGEGRLRGHDKVEVVEVSGRVLPVECDAVVLAPGSTPSEIPALPVDGERVITSDHFFSMREVPKEVLVVGGGVVGCELAFLLSALGSRVMLVEALGRVLPMPGLDPQSSLVLQREMRKLGMEVVLNTTVSGMEGLDGGLRIYLEQKAGDDPCKGPGRPREVQVEKVLVCVGRRPNTQSMGLEELGVKMDHGGWISADATMETSVEGIYAVGDVLGPSKGMLAHVAMAEGQVAAESIMGLKAEMDYDLIPLVAYTEPEVASVGLTEEQARTQGLDVQSETVLVRLLGRAQAEGQIAGQGKVVLSRDRRRILGVHLVGPCASELVTQGALAIRMGASVEDMAHVLAPHPSFSELLVEIYNKAAGRPIHGS